MAQDGERGGARGPQPARARPGTGVTIRVPVRWGDLDALGHVNNTKLFQYCESGRIAYFEGVGLDRFKERPTDGPGLVQAELSFRRQVRYPATVVVETHATRIGGRSFTLAYRLTDEGDGEVCAEGSSVVVWVDYEAGRARPIPGALATAIALLEGDPGLAGGRAATAGESP